MNIAVHIWLSCGGGGTYFLTSQTWRDIGRDIGGSWERSLGITGSVIAVYKGAVQSSTSQ